MKKFLIGLACGLVLAVLSAVVVIFAAVRFGGDRKPPIPAEAVLVVALDGDLPEIAPPDINLPFLKTKAPLTVLDTWDLFRKAAADKRVKAIILRPSGLSAGWAKLSQVRSDIEQFKRSGKPVIAYLQSPGTREYYLATAADKIYLAPEDMLDLKGLRIEAMFYRRTLDKIGAQIEVEYAGKYKDAVDSYARTSMTPETREVLNSVLDSVYGQIVGSIAQGRKQTPEKVKQTIDDGPFLAEQAMSAGLIDQVAFEDQMWSELKKRVGGSVEKVGHGDYVKVSASSLGLEGSTRIAFVTGDGAITRGGGGIDPLGSADGIRSATFTKLLREVGDDAKIRGVILRINSPGGDAIASEEILHEVRELSRKKPTVISMSDMAASGGYYMAMTGDPVFAYDMTYTGSIGVLFGKVNLAGLYEKLGFNIETLVRGKNADIDSASKPLSEAGRKKLREGIDRVYQTFLQRVSEGRKKPVSVIEPLAQGRVWMGSQARNNGLIDQIGGLDQVIAKLREKAKLGSEKLTLVVYPKKRSLIEQLLESDSSELLEARVAKRIGLNPEILKLLSKGGMLKVAPYTIRID